MATCSKGHVNPQAQRFCGECGEPLHDAPAARAPSAEGESNEARATIFRTERPGAEAHATSDTEARPVPPSPQPSERPAPGGGRTLAERIASERASDGPTSGAPAVATATRPEPTAGPTARAAPTGTIATAGSRFPTFRVALAVALIPFLVGVLTVLIAGRGFHLTADEALTELNVRDVGHHLVEVGVFNRFGWHHLGPLYFYALAPLYRILGSRSYGLLVGALLINAATVVGIGLVARRRGGDGFAVATLAGTLLVAHSFGASFVSSPWTPNIVVLATVLCVLLAWSLAELDTAVLPWAAFVASWTVQAHLPPIAAIAGTLIAGLIIGGGRLRVVRRRDPHAAVLTSLPRRLAIAGAVLLVAWLLPLVDVITHAGGNVGDVIDYFLNSPGGTLANGYRVVSNQLAVPPPWLNRYPVRFDVLAEHVVTSDGVIPWIGIGLLAGLLVAGRAKQSRALRFGLIVAIALVMETVAIGRIKGRPFYFDLLYVPATAMLAALATGYIGWSVLERRTSRPWLRPAATALLIALLAVPASALAVSSADINQVKTTEASKVVAAVESGTLRSLRGVSGPVLVRDTRRVREYHDLAGIVLLLRQHGVDAVVLPSLHVYFPKTVIRSTNSYSAVVTLVPLPDVFNYRPVRTERLAATGGSTKTVFGKLLSNGYSVFVAQGSTAGRLRPGRIPRKRAARRL
jgi:hypothetical protein